jgi:SAM-dependent methyltransferase
MGTVSDDADGPRWSGTTYAGAAAHHRRVDDWFLAQHPVRETDHVVDAGCGSGEFSARLASLVPRGTVVGVEPDPSMLAAAQRHEAPNLAFRAGRLQDLDRVCEPGSVDLVVSRAVFHWLPLEAYHETYATILRVLRPGGWLHAESGGTGNVDRLRGLLDEVAARMGLPPASVTFPDAGTALELLEDAGFELPWAGVTTVAQRRPFDRDGLLGLVRTQAAMAYGLGADHSRLSSFGAAAEAELDRLRRRDGSYDQTFVRLHVRARRPA